MTPAKPHSPIIEKILEDSKKAMNGEKCMAAFNDFRGTEEDACRACPNLYKFDCRRWTEQPVTETIRASI